MDARVAKRMQTIRVLWFALLPSNFVFVGLLANGFGSHERNPNLRLITGELAGLSLGLTIVAFALPARLLAKAIGAMRVEVVDEAGETAGGFRQAAVVTRRVARPADVLLDGLARWQSAFLVGMALAESISLFGFMLGFLGAPATSYLAFIAAGFTMMLLKFPRLETVKAAIERASGATLKP